MPHERDLRHLFDLSRFRIGRRRVEGSKKFDELTGEMGRLGQRLAEVAGEFGYNNFRATVLKKDEIVGTVSMEKRNITRTMVFEVDDRGLNAEKKKPEGTEYTWESDREGQVFYRPRPDADALVQDPTDIRPNQPVMWAYVSKLEQFGITAHEAGEVTFVVENGQTVKPGDPLFYIRPHTHEK